jgi:ribosomal protein S18 acetylase RimI-like enzyme
MAAPDLALVGVLAGSLVRLHHAYDPQRFLLLGDPEKGYARWLGSQLDEDDVILLVAESDEAPGVIGYAYARMEPRSYNELLDACVKLHDICVDARARQHGAGEALLGEVIRIATAKGAPRIVLLTASQNETAQRLFRRLGFRSTMIEMTRELDPSE